MCIRDSPAIVKAIDPEDNLTVVLRIPVCAEEEQRLAISMRIGGRWRLVGYGFIQGGSEYKPG